MQSHSSFSSPPQPTFSTRPEAPTAGPGDESLDLGKYIHALRRRWLIILVCLLAAVGYAVVRNSLTPKEYKSKALIQIERKRLSLLALGQAGWMEDWWNMEYYPTQYLLLRSRGMAERVIYALDLHQHPHYVGPGGPLDIKDSLDQLDGDSRTQLARLAARVQAGLVVNPISDTQMVELIYHSTDPELASTIANAYADVFIEWGKRNRTSSVNQASSFLEQQTETLRQEIEIGQRDLNTYTSSSDFVLDPAGEALVQRRQTLEKQYNDVVANRISREAAYQGIQRLSPDTVAASQAGPQVNAIKAELSQLEIEYENKLDTFRPDSSFLVDLQETIQNKRDQLQRLVDETYEQAKGQAYAEYQKARQEEESLEAERRRLAADARLQNSNALEYSNLVTYIETRKELLAELIKRQSEVASQVQTSQESNIRVVDHAIVPTSPFRPSLSRGLIFASGFGIFIAVGGILLLEFLDRTIKTPEELESIFGLPTLTVVPDLADSQGGRKYGGSYGYGYGYSQKPEGGGKSRRGKDSEGDAPPQIELLPHLHPRLAICEAYRSLRTALLLSSADELKMVALTSAEPGEGKTATTSNLAIVMAQLGRRVLVIDADLRRPRMHKVFKTSNRVGLVNYLTAHIDISSVFIETGVPNLSLCPSGPIPPNPSELLASERMREFLHQVRQRFDFVLVDTPPALPVADAVILGPQVDGMVVCARAGVLQREEAKLCRERLRYGDLRLFGLVLNRYSSSPTGYRKGYGYYTAYEEPQASSSAA